MRTVYADTESLDWLRESQIKKSAANSAKNTNQRRKRFACFALIRGFAVFKLPDYSITNFHQSTFMTNKVCIALGGVVVWKGEPGMGVNAPVFWSMLKPLMLLDP